GILKDREYWRSQIEEIFKKNKIVVDKNSLHDYLVYIYFCIIEEQFADKKDMMLLIKYIKVIVNKVIFREDAEDRGMKTRNESSVVDSRNVSMIELTDDETY